MYGRILTSVVSTVVKILPYRPLAKLTRDTVSQNYNT